MVLPLEIKQSGDKLLPTRISGGGVFLGEASRKIHREMKLGTLGWISRRWDVGVWTGLGWARI